MPPIIEKSSFMRVASFFNQILLPTGRFLTPILYNTSAPMRANFKFKKYKIFVYRKEPRLYTKNKGEIISS
jgi:hypothetical protein